MFTMTTTITDSDLKGTLPPVEKSHPLKPLEELVDIDEVAAEGEKFLKDKEKIVKEDKGRLDKFIEVVEKFTTKEERKDNPKAPEEGPKEEKEVKKTAKDSGWNFF